MRHAPEEYYGVILPLFTPGDHVFLSSHPRTIWLVNRCIRSETGFQYDLYRPGHLKCGVAEVDLRKAVGQLRSE